MNFHCVRCVSPRSGRNTPHNKEEYLDRMYHPQPIFRPLHWSAALAGCPGGAGGSRLRLRAGTYRAAGPCPRRSEEHTSELQSRGHLVCRLLLEKKRQVKVHVLCDKKKNYSTYS